MAFLRSWRELSKFGSRPVAVAHDKIDGELRGREAVPRVADAYVPNLSSLLSEVGFGRG